MSVEGGGTVSVEGGALAHSWLRSEALACAAALSCACSSLCRASSSVCDDIVAAACERSCWLSVSAFCRSSLCATSPCQNRSERRAQGTCQSQEASELVSRWVNAGKNSPRRTAHASRAAAAPGSRTWHRHCCARPSRAAAAAAAAVPRGRPHGRSPALAAAPQRLPPWCPAPPAAVLRGAAPSPAAPAAAPVRTTSSLIPGQRVVKGTGVDPPPPKPPLRRG